MLTIFRRYFYLFKGHYNRKIQKWNIFTNNTTNRLPINIYFLFSEMKIQYNFEFILCLIEKIYTFHCVFQILRFKFIKCFGFSSFII